MAEAKIPEPVDSARVVADAVGRGRLHVWENGEPVSMAAWTGKTPNGVRINFVYTPRELRGKGYGTACVSALTKQQLAAGQRLLLALHRSVERRVAKNLQAHWLSAGVGRVGVLLTVTDDSRRQSTSEGLVQRSHPPPKGLDVLPQLFVIAASFFVDRGAGGEVQILLQIAQGR